MKSVIVLLLFVCAQANGQRGKLGAYIMGAIKGLTSVLPDDHHDTVQVKLELTLTNIVNYSPVDQVLETTGYLVHKWADKSLAWNPHDYGNLSHLSFPCDHLPKPDIKLYNGARHGMHVDTHVECFVDHTGHLTYIPIVAIESFCPTDDPAHDTFTCHLKFGSWTNRCTDMNITRSNHMLHLADFEGGWRWDILEHSEHVTEMIYSCCPEVYCALDLKLKIRDKSRPGKGHWYFEH